MNQVSIISNGNIMVKRLQQSPNKGGGGLRTWEQFPSYTLLLITMASLNMAKYTIVSLILIDFVPICFIVNLFGVQSASKKSKVDFRGWGRSEPLWTKSKV